MKVFTDYLFILDWNLIILDVKFPINENILDLSPIEIRDTKITDCNLGPEFNTKITRALDLIEKTGQTQEFLFELNLKEYYQLKCKVTPQSQEKEKEHPIVLVIQDNTSHAELEKKFREVNERKEEVEKEIGFFIKQGDIVTKQRAKIQQERDELATEKTEMIKQKELMEEELDFIMKQGDKIAEQKAKIIKQHKIVKKQKQKIEDSIFYAKRIQSAVLPPNRFIQHLLVDHFIFYKPRDIVSGDFYWIKQIDDKILIAAADCTGHGVPGALMSMLGITFLNEIVNKNPQLHANEVLNELRMHVISSLRQTGGRGESRDGMDMALCIIDNKKRIMEYAGANNPLYLLRNKELEAVKADRMPIGIHRKAKEPFKNNVIDLKNDDIVYIFSDGFIDQFGGEHGHKYMAGNFKKLLLSIQEKPMKDQKEILEQTFNEWKGNHKQLDDILVIGFKISFEKSFSKSPKQYSWEGKTVLVAEDDRSNFLLLQKILSKSGLNILHAEDGKEAVNMVKEHEEIDLILMDIRMPRMDGIEATQNIKQLRSDLPVIVQTAYTMSSEKEKSFKAGCDDYVSKPINMKELFSTISKYIESDY